MSGTPERIKIVAISTELQELKNILEVLHDAGKFKYKPEHISRKYLLLYNLSGNHNYSCLSVTSLRDFSNERLYELKVLE